MLEKYLSSNYAVEPTNEEPFAVKVGELCIAANGRLARYEPPSISIITAWNPLSCKLGKSLNEQRNTLLHNDLRRRKLEIHSALGTGQDGWAEPSFAVENLPRADLIFLALCYGQNAVVRLGLGQPDELICVMDEYPIPDLTEDTLLELLHSLEVNCPEGNDWERIWRLVLPIGATPDEIDNLSRPAILASAYDNDAHRSSIFAQHVSHAAAHPVRWQLFLIYIRYVARWHRDRSAVPEGMEQLARHKGIRPPKPKPQLDLDL